MLSLRTPALLLLALSSLTACGSSGGGGGGAGASQVSAPSAGSYWGGTRVIQWEPMGGEGPVTLEVSGPGGWTTIVASTKDDGKYTWDTSAAADGGDRRVRVRKEGQEPIRSGLFTLDNTAPVLTLIDPGGGELWGGEKAITWSTVEANPEYVDLLVSSDGGTSYDLPVGVATPDDGSHTWDTTASADGSAYRVMAVATDKAGNQSVPVSSASNFELDNTAPTVTLTAPVGGEQWDLERTITWITDDQNPSAVQVALSTDGGLTYDHTIANPSLDLGFLAWNTGLAPDGSQMRVRIIATDGAGNSSAPDASAGDFMITNLRLLQPIHYLDVNANATIDAGDELYLLYDKDVVVNGAVPEDLLLPVVGDTLGVGASVTAGPELHSVLVTLGTSPVLRTRGVYDPEEVAVGRPGGLDISQSMTPDAIEEAGTGRDAAPSGPKDLVPGFVAGAALPAGTDSTSRGALGDLDGDGALDLVVGSTGGGPDVRFVGDGLGGWTLTQSFGASDSRDVALGDLDGDGDLDLVVAAQGANRVWLNDGAGVLSDTGQALGSSDSRSVVLGDFDRDGDLDAGFGNWTGQGNTVWWNDGTGTFTDSGQSLGAADTSTLASGDLDRDGDLDLVAANFGVDSRVWRNDGTGGFKAGAFVTLTDAQDLALGDLDGDGDLDAFFAVLGQNEVVPGNGNGGFGPTRDFLGNNDHRAVELLDLDGDGDLDAVTAKYLDADRYWYNDGYGWFTEDPKRGEVDNSTDVIVGHLDADADEDLVLVNDLHTHRTHLSSHAGGQPLATLEDSGARHGAWRSGAPAVGDVNGDGHQDVVVPDRSGTVHVLSGDGAGGLEPSGAFGALDGRGGDLFDADRDGDLDYLQRVGELGVGLDRLWIGDGAGGFVASNVLLGPETFVAGDLDADGDEDLVVVDAAWFEVWRGDGEGDFLISGSTAATSGYLFGTFADLDRDGDIDFVYGRADDSQVWENDGSGSFALATTLSPGGASGAVTAADYDRDGDLDLVFATDQGLSMLRNDGGLSFSARGITGPRGVPSQVLTTDLNEDGYPDFLVVDRAASSYFLCEGDGGDSLPSPTAEPVEYLSWAGLIDLDGDGDRDVYWSLDDAAGAMGVADRVDLFD